MSISQAHHILYYQNSTKTSKTRCNFNNLQYDFQCSNLLEWTKLSKSSWTLKSLRRMTTSFIQIREFRNPPFPKKTSRVDWRTAHVLISLLRNLTNKHQPYQHFWVAINCDSPTHIALAGLRMDLWGPPQHGKLCSNSSKKTGTCFKQPNTNLRSGSIQDRNSEVIWSLTHNRTQGRDFIPFLCGMLMVTWTGTSNETREMVDPFACSCWLEPAIYLG